MEFLPDPQRVEGWQLTLRPRLPSMARIVRVIRLHGVGAVLESMAVEEATGDVSTTTFTQVDGTRRDSPEEISRLFRVVP